jgi:hypothetical protein
MMRLAPPLLLLVVARLLSAQGSPAVRGVVHDAHEAPLAYATVELSPGGERIFADDSGRFLFPRVEAGRYTLRVRRLGYVPRDTIVTVAGEPLVLALHLDRLAITLSEMRVVARPGCTRPGPPDPGAEPVLAAIFEQLRENSERWRLLALRHPFSSRVERRTTLRIADGSATGAGTDTVLVASGSKWSYTPGHVVTTVPGANGPTRQMNLPGLPELADTTFHNAHCFSYAGIQRVRGTEYVRVDFRPADTLSTPDVDGSVYLDTDGYQLRRAEVRLTHPELVQPTLKELRATTSFREILPSVVILDGVEGTSSFWETGPRSTTGRTERQRMVSVVWLAGAPPGAVTP